MSQPPPPRYRIVERGGRLVTIDTWAKGAPAPPPEAIGPDRASANPPRPSRRGRSNAGGPVGFDALGDVLMSILFQTRDEAGRRVLTTGPGLDRHGPRTIALSPSAERRLGRVLAVAALIVLAGLVVVIVDPEVLLALLLLGVLAAGLLGTAAPAAITRFLDTLDDDLPR